MSLDWDVSKVKDFETVTTVKKQDGEFWAPQTEALVWHSMVCGFNEISDKNWKHIWNRIRVWEKVKGPMMYQVPLTEEDVQKHIGMRTNASRKTLAQFTKDLMDE